MSPRSIDNGARLPVAFPFYTGLAGVRLSGDGGELACHADVPYPASDISGQVDGRPATIITARRSDTAEGMVVARFHFTDEASA